MRHRTDIGANEKVYQMNACVLQETLALCSTARQRNPMSRLYGVSGSTHLCMLKKTQNFKLETFIVHIVTLEENHNRRF